MSLFQIDEALAARVESAQDAAAANDGELSKRLRTANVSWVSQWRYYGERFTGLRRSEVI